MLKSSLLPILAVLAAAAGCNASTEPLRSDANVVAHEQLWSASAPNSYHFTLATHCFCARDSLAITVQNGVVTSAVNLYSNTAVANPSTLPTIDTLYAIAERAVRTASTFIITYDEQRRIPTLMTIDWNEKIADDEIEYAVRDFGT